MSFKSHWMPLEFRCPETTLRKAVVKTFQSTVEPEGACTERRMTTPFEGLGKGGDTTIDENPAVEVAEKEGVGVSVTDGVKVKKCEGVNVWVTVDVGEEVGVLVGTGGGVLVLVGV